MGNMYSGVWVEEDPSTRPAGFIVANRLRNPGPKLVVFKVFVLGVVGIKSTGMMRWVTGWYCAVVGVGGGAVTKKRK